MRILFILNLLGLLLMQLSCTEKDYISSNSKTFVIDISDPKDIMYSQLFDTCYIIPLESRADALIGNVKKVILNDNNIIVFDKNKTKSVFIYDWSGNLENVIYKEGEGPSEYIHPLNLSVSESGEKVYIMDSMGGKQVRYNLDGSFIDGIRLLPETRYSDLIVKGNNFYAANGGVFERQKYINKYDNKFNLISQIKVSFNDDIWLQNGIKTSYFFEKFNSSGFYYKGFRTNRILNIEKDSIIEDINFKFSDKSFTYNPEEPIQVSKFNEMLSRNENYIVGDQIIDSKSIMFIDIQQGYNLRMAIYNKLKQKVQLVDYLVNDMDGVISEISGEPVELSNANFFVTLASPRFYKSVLEKGLIDGPYKKYLQKITLEDTANPILFIYPIKEIIDD